MKESKNIRTKANKNHHKIQREILNEGVIICLANIVETTIDRMVWRLTQTGKTPRKKQRSQFDSWKSLFFTTAATKENERKPFS